MDLLETALRVAVLAHFGQRDKSGQAYIFHPLRVMNRCESIEAKVAALLHDTVEDTSVTLDQLRQEGFPDAILHTVERLTHRPEVSYEDYIQGLWNDPVAITVKLADLEDNSDLKRLPTLETKDIERLKKYHHYYQLLKKRQSELEIG